MSDVSVRRERVRECGERYGREEADERTEVSGRSKEDSVCSREKLTGRLGGREGGRVFMLGGHDCTSLILRPML